MKKIIYVLRLFFVLGLFTNLSAQSICPTYTIHEPPAYVSPGDVFCSEVRVNNFYFSVYSTLDINYDLAVYDSIYAQDFLMPNLTAQNFAVVDTGIFRMSWQSSHIFGSKIPDDFAVFKLCFQVKDDIGGGGLTNFSEELPLALLSGCVQHSDCATDPLHAIEISAGGGTPPYTFNWIGPNSFSANTQNLQNLPPGTYTVTVTDVNNSSITADFEVLRIEGEETFTMTYCEGECPFANPLPCISGIYQDKITTASGCDSIFYTHLNIIPQAITNIGTFGICGSDCITFAASEYCDEGNYSVVFTDAMGCDSIVEFSISLLQSDIIQSITNDTVLCDPTNFQLEVIAPDAISYEWFPADNLSCTTCPNPTIMPLFSEFYTVIVTNADGCIDEASVYVEIPFGLDWGLFPWSNSPICEGEDLQFISQVPIDIVTWEWSGPNGFFSNLEAPIIPNATSVDAGFYSVTVTDANGCSGVADFDVTVNENPIADAGPDMELTCVTPTVTLDGSGSSSGVNFVYQWWGTPGISNIFTQNPIVIEAGIYHLIVTDINGCTSLDEVEVFANTDLLTIAIDFPEFCIESSVDICATVTGGSGDFEYAWSSLGTPVSTDQCFAINNFSVDDIGDYEVVVTDLQNGCSNVQTFTLAPSECVWPGDTDTNKVVNNFDLLNIGLAFDSTGSVRPNASINWQGELADDWTQTTPDGINYKHIDCDGNGIINADDTLAITQNWGLTHNLWGVDDRNVGAPFYVQSDTFTENTTYAIPVILGEENFPAEEVYGLAFTLNFDTSIIASNASIDFNESWLGGINADMIGIQKTTFYTQGGRIDAGVTRIDGQNMTGFGQLGTFYITIEDIIFQAPPGGDANLIEKELIFTINNVKMIGFNGEEIEVDTEPQPSVSTNTNSAFLNSQIKVFPNPTTDFLNIDSPEFLMEKVEIFNIAGQRVLSNFEKTNQLSFNTKNWQYGTYFIKIQTAEGMVLKKIIK